MKVLVKASVALLKANAYAAPCWGSYYIFAINFIIISTENEVDGESFLQLTDEDIGQMVKPVAIKRKLINQRQHFLSLNTVSDCAYVASYIHTLIMLMHGMHVEREG